MWTRRAFYLGLSVFSILGGVLADKTITVDGQDQSIKYTTVSNGDSGATWTPVQRSADSCDTPQMLTSRLGDYMTYTFTGTGIFVIGTVGVKQGIINFVLDGQNMTNFNRGRSELICDQVLFQYTGLPNQQHTVVATLVGRNTNLQTGQPDGVLSVQRVRYTIPGSDSSTPVGPIVGGIVGAIALIGACGAAYYFWRRRRPTRRNNAAFWDNDDIGGGKPVNPGIVATPFEWDGPSKPHGAEGNGGGHYGGVERDQTPGSPSFAANQPLLGQSSPPWSASAHTTSFSGPSTSSQNNSSNPNVYYNQLGAPMAGPRTQTSSGSSEERRRSGMTGSTLVAANPDPGRAEKNPAMFAMGPIGGRHDGLSGPAAAGVGHPGVPQPGRPTSGPIDDTQLVDRIAHRLADIMTERVGVGSDAPPSYVGEDGEFYASPPPPQGATQETSPPQVGGSSSYPPQSTTSPRPPTSPQYVHSPASASASGQQLQPPTPPAGSTSFGGQAARFGPRPRPSGSVSGRPGEYGAQPPTAQRSMSGSKEQPTSARGASWRAESSSPPS